MKLNILLLKICIRNEISKYIPLRLQALLVTSKASSLVTSRFVLYLYRQSLPAICPEKHKINIKMRDRIYSPDKKKTESLGDISVIPFSGDLLRIKHLFDDSVFYSYISANFVFF